MPAPGQRKGVALHSGGSYLLLSESVMASENPAERRNVLYAGRVQGVGFRVITKQIAQGFAVTGFVRNLSSGKVELVVEGNATEIDAFLGQIADRMGPNISDSVITRTAATGEFRSFEVASS